MKQIQVHPNEDGGSLTYAVAQAFQMDPKSFTLKWKAWIIFDSDSISTLGVKHGDDMLVEPLVNFGVELPPDVTTSELPATQPFRDPAVYGVSVSTDLPPTIVDDDNDDDLVGDDGYGAAEGVSVSDVAMGFDGDGPVEVAGNATPAEPGSPEVVMRETFKRPAPDLHSEPDIKKQFTRVKSEEIDGTKRLAREVGEFLQEGFRGMRELMKEANEHTNKKLDNMEAEWGRWSQNCDNKINEALASRKARQGHCRGCCKAGSSTKGH